MTTRTIESARAQLAAAGFKATSVTSPRVLPARIAARIAQDDAAADARTVHARMAMDMRRRQQASNRTILTRKLPIPLTEPYALSLLTGLTLWEGLVPRSPYAADFEAHLQRVAQLHSLRIVWGSVGTGSAYVRSRIVHTPRPLTDVAYACGLHELGHVLTEVGAVRQVPNGQGGTVSPEAELAAWRWARRACLYWTPAMQTLLCVALRTYAVYATSRELREFDALMGLGEIRR